MKHLILIGTWLSCASALFAQAEEKQVTVRIKKVENINGVEKITDTTITTKDAASYAIHDGNLETIEWNEKDEEGKKIIRIEESIHSPEIIIDNESDGPTESFTIKSLNGQEGTPKIKKIIVNDPSGKADSEEISRRLNVELKDLEEEMKGKEGQHKMIFINTECEKKGDKEDVKETKIIIIKKVMISEPSAEDSKMLNKQTGISDEKLQVENMKFFPNPNDGKFNLEFQVTSKGDTELNILNMEGKSIYNENLKNFSGQYSNAINISDQPKGVYFVKIKQGKHAQVKKIVLE